MSQEFTKEERYIIYTILLYYAEHYDEYLWDECRNGLCYLAKYELGIDLYEGFDQLPELKKRAPQWFARYWFAINETGWEKRREILSQVVREMEELLTL